MTLVGRSLGRYHLDDLLGQGGMAEVYQASDVKLARTVAVKVVLPSYAADARFLERFLREARVVASLEHPNILPVYDFGEEDGFPYLVMPYLPGGSLCERMWGSPTPLPQAASWIRQLAEALDFAHAAGVLHRDVKPANVLIGKDDRLALADFGIAKMLETASGLTATGVVVGTPIYLSPEQAAGKPATPASDRYSLAVLAYELLSGKPPFEGESALSLMNQHATAPVPALSTRVRGLPGGLDAVLRKALSKEPENRHPTCLAFAEQVAAFCPTGSLLVVESAAKSITSETELIEPPIHAASATSAASQSGAAPSRAGTSRPIPVRTVPPGLTSGEAGEGRGTGRHLVWITIGAAAVLVAAVTFLLRGRGGPQTASPSPSAVTTSVPSAASAPPAAPTHGPETAAIASSSAAEQATTGDAARLEKLAGAVDDAIARGKLAPPEEGNALAALAVLKREFPASKAVPQAEGRLAEGLKREATRALERGDYAGAKTFLLQARTLRPDDAEIASKLQVAEVGIKPATTSRAAPPSLVKPSPAAAAVVPTAVERPAASEAERERPGDPRALFGHARESSAQGRHAEAAAAAMKAHPLVGSPIFAAVVADFAADELSIEKRYEEAVTWYRKAIAAPGPVAARAALKAARVCRENLGREDDALELFRIACRRGVPEACPEVGEQPGRPGRQRPRDRGPGKG